MTAAATDTTLARIIHAVEEAQGSRAPMQRFVDTFARYYTPAVFLVALLAALVPPLFLGSAWTDAIYTALVILVIGCPCALVISTPVSIVSGMAAATRYGILIKGGMFLEQGRRLDCLALDKTGTLTHGKPRQTDCLCTGQEDEAAVRSLAASLAARSDHPVSGAIAQAALADHIPLQDVDDFTALPGQGVSGIMAGRRWYLGNRALAASLGRYPAALDERISRLEQQGKTAPTRMECSADITVAAYIPESYVPAARQRMDLYRRIAALRTPEDESELTDELLDRYGDVPPPVTALLRVALLRAAAMDCGVTDITQKGRQLVFSFDDRVDAAALLAVCTMAAYRSRAQLSAGAAPRLTLYMQPGEEPLAAAGALVEALRLHETDTQQMNGAQTPEEAKHEE